MNNFNSNNFNYRGNSLNSRGTIAYQGTNMPEQLRHQNNFPAFNIDWRNQSSGYVPNQNNMAEQMHQNSLTSFNNNWQNQSSGQDQMPPAPLPPYNIDWRNQPAEQIRQDSFRSFNTNRVNQSFGNVPYHSQDALPPFNSASNNQSLNLASNQNNLAEQIIRNAISLCNSGLGTQSSRSVSNNFNMREQSMFSSNNNWNEQSRSFSSFDNNSNFGYNNTNKMVNNQRDSQFMNSSGSGNKYRGNKRTKSNNNRNNSNVNSKLRKVESNNKSSERNRSTKNNSEVNKHGRQDDPMKNGLSENGVTWYLHYLRKGFPPQVARKKALKSEHILSKQAVKTFAMNCKLGEPGGRDDPFRMGLSGAGVKWYFRYLKLGLSPQDARKKVDGRPNSLLNKQTKKSENKIKKPVHGKDTLNTAKTTPTNVVKQSQELPRMGEPGGLDDPLRKGLSGSGIKWYLRFLKQGLKPEDARKKAEEHKVSASNSAAVKGNDKGKLQPQPIKSILKKPDNKLDSNKQCVQDLYQRFLKQGMKPEDARKKADEHRNPSTNSTLNSTDNKPSQRPELGQANKQISKTKAVVGQQKDNNSTKLEAKNNISNPNSHRIAVLPKAYPQEVLSSENQTILEEIIMKEVLKGWKTPLVFKGINFKQGLLLIDCADQDTADWLKSKIPDLDSWKGTELMACHRDEVPQTYSMNIHLPRTTQSECEKSLSLIKAQNEGLDTTLWKVVFSKEFGQNLQTNIIIDKKSFDTIKEQGNSIHYRFGKLTVNLNKSVSTVQEKSEIPRETDSSIEVEILRDKTDLTTEAEKPSIENNPLTDPKVPPASTTEEATPETKSLNIKQEIVEGEVQGDNKQLPGKESSSANI